MKVTFKSKLLILLVSIFLIGSFVGAIAGDCPVENTDMNEGCYETIQEAINDGKSGDTIEVSSRVYEEHITINKSITLKGPNADIDPTNEDAVRDPEAEITVVKDAPSLTIQADGVTVSGFKLSGSDLTAKSGILVKWEYNSVTLKNNIIEGYREHAIRLRSVQDVLVKNNLIKNNGINLIDSGKEFTGNHGAIRADNSSNVTISGNEVKENRLAGIKLIGTPNSSIIGNIVKRNHLSPCGLPLEEAVNTDNPNCHLGGVGVGISNTDGKKILVDNNQFSYNDRGSVIGDANNVEIKDNDFNYNLMHGIHILTSTVSFHDNDVIANGRFSGVGIIGGSDNRIIDNDIEDNDSSGIGISGHGEGGTTRDNEVRGNDVLSNKQGISIGGSSHENKIKGNTIEDNKYLGISLSGWTKDEETSNSQSAKTTGAQALTVSVKPEDHGLGGTSTTGTSGTNYSPSGNEIVDGNTLTGNHIGIGIYGSSGNDIRENDISENEYRGITVKPSSNHQSNGNDIVSNEIADNASDGIDIKLSSDNLVSSNFITGNESFGIEMHKSSSNVIRNNTIEKTSSSQFPDDWTGIGIVLSESKDNTIKGNGMKDNNKGLMLIASKDNFINGNDIEGNNKGIVLFNSSNNQFFGYNDIIDNRIGIHLPEEKFGDVNLSPNNEARCNTIAGNDEFGVLNEMDYESNPDYYFDAKYNWWGHPSGPEVATKQSGKPKHPGKSKKGKKFKGKGDRISGGVLYKPWLKKLPEESPHCPIYLSENESSSNSIQQSELNVQSFQVSSNPVVSNEQITFKATGEGINQVKVAVFNADGEQLFDSGFVNGSTVSWNATTRNGKPISNGIYLFRMAAKGSGELVRSEIRKLLVVK